MKNRSKENARKGHARMHDKHDTIEGAFACSHNALISAIKENPESVNDQDENGLTSAHIAVGLSNYAFLRRVCSAPEFDPFITDNFNRRAIDCINKPNMGKYRKLLMHRMYGVFPELVSELNFSKPTV